MRVHLIFDESTEEGQEVIAFYKSLPKRYKSAKITNILYQYITGDFKKEDEIVTRPAKKAEATVETEKKESEKAPEEKPEVVSDEVKNLLLEGLSRF